MPDSIQIRGARQNNLQNIDITIPRDKLVVITGLSGSGIAPENPPAQMVSWSRRGC